MEKTTKQVRKIPNPAGKGGFGDNPSHRNNGGRPRNPLKEYQREKFSKMTDEEKDAFLERVSPIDTWKMAEGNPESTTDITTGGQKLNTVDEKAIALAQEYEKKLKDSIT